jgi:hypothetical protein
MAGGAPARKSPGVFAGPWKMELRRAALHQTCRESREIMGRGQPQFSNAWYSQALPVPLPACGQCLAVGVFIGLARAPVLSASERGQLAAMARAGVGAPNLN